METEKRPARAFTDEFRQKAVARLAAGEKRVDIGRELDISPTLIGEWKKKIDKGEAFAQRKSYDEAFKRAAVARILNETRRDIAKDLGIHESMLHEWKVKFENATGKKLPLQRKAYTDDFKRKAVARVLKGETQSAVGKALGVHSGVISNWVKDAKNVPKPKSGPGTGKRGPDKAPRKSPSGYIKKADRIAEAQAANASAPESGNAGRAMAIQTCIIMLRRIRPKIDTTDPVHLTAMLVLATLEGKL